MAKLLGTALIVSFLAIAVFGFLAMSKHAMEGEHTRCITETAAGEACPANDSFAAAVFHLSVFRGFSQAALGNPALGVLLAMAFLAMLIFALWKRRILVPLSLEAERECRRRVQRAPVPAQKNLLRWLSFLEHSPSLA